MSESSVQFSVPMWKYVLPPVILVALVWACMSIGTTVYVHWIESESQRILTENVTSITAADNLQRYVSRINDNWPETQSDLVTFRRFWNSISQDLDDGELTLQISARTSGEQLPLDQLTNQLDQLRTLVNPLLSAKLVQEGAGLSDEELASIGFSIRKMTTDVSSFAGQIKSINQKLIDDATARRSVIGEIVFTVRMLMLFAGPLLGVFLGWRLSERLKKSVTQIAVTLQQSQPLNSVELGTVVIPSNAVFGSVQQQAEHVVARLRDTILELERTRSEIIRSERLAAVGELAAGVAHELRNPLTSVKLLLQYALRQQNPPGLSADKLQFILEEIARMETTIQGLLDFSRIRALNRSVHDFRTTLQRAINLVEGRARQNRIELNIHNSPEPLLVNADAEQVNQVLINVLINGIEAMTDGGCLRIEAGLSEDHAHAQIEIRDSGLGIPVEVLPRLFDPFATSKERGTGLGLAISRRIIDDHDGLLTGKNHPEGGAVFTITLPVYQPESLKSQLLNSPEASPVKWKA